MARPKKGQPVQAQVIPALLPEAIAAASGNHCYSFAVRQLFYAVRPRFIEVFDKEPKYKTFSDIVGTYENVNGDIPGMYRDDRGLLYHPHRGEEIPLGTKSVASYARPSWTFNKIIYIEKGGFVSLLREARWPELHDCAILTSQGHATRAVKDLFDLLGETDEPLTFFAVHDADGYGTRIYTALQEATLARPRRNVEIVNLGLDPEEALEMGLPVEPVDAKTRVPAGDYLSEEWREWLQTKRIELNAMSSPQFIDWLEAKMAPYDTGKVIPPDAVLEGSVTAHVDAIVEAEAEDNVRERLGFDDLVEEERKRLLSEVSEVNWEGIRAWVQSWLDKNPNKRWSSPLLEAARSIVDEDGAPWAEESSP